MKVFSERCCNFVELCHLCGIAVWEVRLFVRIGWLYTCEDRLFVCEYRLFVCEDTNIIRLLQGFPDSMMPYEYVGACRKRMGSKSRA